MRKSFKKSLLDLINENKKELLNDPEAILKLEEKFEKKHAWKQAK